MSKKKKVKSRNVSPQKIPLYSILYKKIKMVAGMTFTILSPAILITAIVTGDSSIQNKFDNLSTNTRNVFYIDEFLHQECNSNDKDKETRIQKNIAELRESLKNLINQHAALGKFVPVETYCKLHEFTYYNDQIQSLSTDVCQKGKLKTIQELSVWKKSILINIEGAQSNRTGPISAIKEYFNLNNRAGKYSPEDCKRA